MPSPLRDFSPFVLRSNTLPEPCHHILYIHTLSIATMQLTSLLSGTALVAAAAVQANLQINYYSDNGCHNYVNQRDVTWATNINGGGNNCYNYEYGTSANIANCDTGSCLCNFFFNQGCTGGSFQTRYSNGGSNCLTAIANYKSFACYYT